MNMNYDLLRDQIIRKTGTDTEGKVFPLALASDFDKTFYFRGEDPAYKPQDLAAVEKFRKRGNLFGLCTGRSLKGVTLVLQDQIRFDFMILVSGALIVDGNYKTIYKQCLPGELAEHLYIKYESRGDKESGTYVVIQANDTVYSFYDDYPLQTRIHSFDELKDADFYGLSFGLATPEKASDLTAEINALYGDAVNAYTNVCNVDIVPKGCSKGHALQILKEKLGLPWMAGIGDSYNDIPMLRAADHSFTFTYSPETIRMEADMVVENLAQAVDILLTCQEGN